jgi:peptidoglycan/xylan/chitin deacetylase (PgdA/CDA1 family)
MGGRAWPGRRFANCGALALLALLACTMRGAEAETAHGMPPSAVVFAYSRFAEDSSPRTSIRLDQFDAHLAELSIGGYEVLPMPRIVEALETGTPLSDRTVAITIDDAHRSVYQEAWPRLRSARLPFTLFVATDPIDRGSETHMTWNQLRELVRAGVGIGALPATGTSLFDDPAERAAAEVARSVRRLEEELGIRPDLFAYSFGDYTLAVRRSLPGIGISAAFTQASGVAQAGGDLLTLPRFVMNEAYGSIDRFRLAASALPMPVTDVTPADPVLVENPPSFGFTVSSPVDGLDRLSCFASGQGRAAVQRIAETRIEVRLAEPFAPGRGRVNCTMPAGEGRWRWFGAQFFVPGPVPE